MSGGGGEAGPARLLCRTGEFAGLDVDLRDEVVVGRESRNDVVLESPLLSRRHARIYRDDGRWWVEDLESRNGTRVDGAAVVGRAPLERLNVISFADAVDLVFVESSATSPAPGSREDARERQGTMLDMAGFEALPELGGEEAAATPAASEASGPGDAAGAEEPAGTQLDVRGFGAVPELGDEAEESAGTKLDMQGFGAMPDLEEEGAEPAGAAFALVVDVPEGGSRTFSLEPGENVVGRSRECDVSIPDPEQGISRRHAVLRVGDDGVVLEDLDSANGTWVGGERVDRASLAPGDEFQLGPSTTFRLVST